MTKKPNIAIVVRRQDVGYQLQRTLPEDFYVMSLGSAMMGRRFDTIFVATAPSNSMEIDWMSYLPTKLSPGGKIVNLC